MPKKYRAPIREQREAQRKVVIWGIVAITVSLVFLFNVFVDPLMREAPAIKQLPFGLEE